MLLRRALETIGPGLLLKLRGSWSPASPVTASGTADRRWPLEDVAAKIEAIERGRTDGALEEKGAAVTKRSKLIVAALIALVIGLIAGQALGDLIKDLFR